MVYFLFSNMAFILGIAATQNCSLCLWYMSSCLCLTGRNKWMSQCWSFPMHSILFLIKDFLGNSGTSCCITGHTVYWIGDFLTGWTQCVVVDGTFSKWSPVHLGVPQGTMLGPLLFSIYINDLPECVSCRVRLFSDDCLVYREIDGMDDQLALQQDLDFLEAWALKWGMKFKPSKCTILSISQSPPLHKFYSLSGTILQHVNQTKYLGANVSDDLHWYKHVQNITSMRAAPPSVYWEEMYPPAPLSFKNRLTDHLLGPDWSIV